MKYRFSSNVKSHFKVIQEASKCHSVVIPLYIFDSFTCINDMNIDMLRITGRWVTLVLPTVLRGHMADDQAGGCEVASVRDDHSAASLPVIRDDLPIVVPEHEWRIEIERTRLNDAGQIDGGPLLNVSLLGTKNLCLWLNYAKKHSMLHVGSCADLKPNRGRSYINLICCRSKC